MTNKTPKRPSVVIIKDLIQHYTEVIEKINPYQDYTEIQHILSINNVEQGVCNCAEMLFGETIMHDKWVEDVPRMPGYNLAWGTFPKWATSHEEAKRLLKFRIDNLEIALKNETA
jgi:hypothetical protein